MYPIKDTLSISPITKCLKQFFCWVKQGYIQEGASYEPGGGLSSELVHAGALIMDTLASGTVRNNLFLFIRHPVCGVFLWQPGECPVHSQYRPSRYTSQSISKQWLKGWPVVLVKVTGSWFEVLNRLSSFVVLLQASFSWNPFPVELLSTKNTEGWFQYQWMTNFLIHTHLFHWAPSPHVLTPFMNSLRTTRHTPHPTCSEHLCTELLVAPNLFICLLGISLSTDIVPIAPNSSQWSCCLGYTFHCNSFLNAPVLRSATKKDPDFICFIFSQLNPFYECPFNLYAFQYLKTINKFNRKCNHSFLTEKLLMGSQTSSWPHQDFWLRKHPKLFQLWLQQKSPNICVSLSMSYVTENV